MNKKLITTLALLLLYYPFFCQAQPVALTTPNGTPVAAFKDIEMPLDCIAVFNHYCVTNYPNAILLDTSTYTYNCHGFAWSMADGGPLCKISVEENNLAKFWNDYSYLESPNYEKIYYEAVNETHSAIVASDPTFSQYYDSKWGGRALMRHLPGDGPEEYYDGATPKYYKRNPYTIECPDSQVCLGSVFTIKYLNSPTSSVAWKVEPAGIISIYPSGGTSTTVTGITGTGTVYLIAHEGYPDEKVITTKYLTITPSTQPAISGSSSVCYDGSDFTLDNVPSNTAIYWKVDNTSLFSVDTTVNPIKVYRIGQGTGSATLSAHTGSVSNSAVATKTITACSPAVISGNSLVCFSSSYSLNNSYKASEWSLPLMDTVFSFSGSHTNTNSVTVVAKPNSTFTTATLTAKIGKALIPYSFILNCALAGSDFLCPTSYYYITNGLPAVWSVTSGFSITPDPDNESGVWITASAPNLSGTVTAVVSGLTTFTLNFSSCDYDVYGRGPSGSSSYVSAYPNPTSSILTIEIDEVMAAQIRAQSNFKTSAATPNFDVRLYDASGVLVRNTQTKGGKVTFDVSALPNGFYYLHVYDGIIPFPEVIKIIVN